MKHYLVAQVDAKELSGLIGAIDGGIAASIEMGDTERKAEAPDGSGRYCFKIYDAQQLAFGDLLNEKEISALKGKINALEVENENLRKELGLANTKVTEVNKENTNLKEEVKEAKRPKRFKRLRSY